MGMILTILCSTRIYKDTYGSGPVNALDLADNLIDELLGRDYDGIDHYSSLGEKESGFVDGTLEPGKIIKVAEAWNESLIEGAKKNVERAEKLAKEKGFGSAMDMLASRKTYGEYDPGYNAAASFIRDAMDIFMGTINYGTAYVVMDALDPRYGYDITEWLMDCTLENIKANPQDYAVINVAYH